LALPVAAVIMVLLRYLHDRYKNSTLYDQQRDSRPAVAADQPAPPAAEDTQ